MYDNFLTGFGDIISKTRHKTFSVQSPPISMLIVLYHENNVFHTVEWRVRPFTVESSGTATDAWDFLNNSF